MSTILLNAGGTPEPSSEIQRRLRQVHPLLELRYIDSIDAHWAICMRWAENDRRWGMVQQQLIDPNRSMDIVGYLPMTCSAEEAPAYLERSLRQFPSEDVQRLVNQMHQYNAEAPVHQAMNDAMAEVLDSPNPTSQPKRRGRPPKVS